MRQPIVISVFSFFLTFFIASYYWILRVGFADNSILVVLKVVGFGAFVLLLPAVLSMKTSFYNRLSTRVFFTETIIPLYVLIIACLLGYLGTILHVDLSIIFILAGYVCFTLCAISFIKKIQFFHKALLIAVAGFFALWVASLSWMHYLKPYLLEGWACGTDKIDTLFHIAIGQMIKTYGVPTTGLDGIPFMDYHWGSHWLFAQLSNFLNLPVIVVYQLCFPAIIAPLLFRTFISFVFEVKQYIKAEPESRRLNFFFWIVFLAVFIGFFKSYSALNSWAQYSSGGTGSTLFMLLSESYTVSIVVMMMILAVCLNFWMNRQALTKPEKIVFLFVLLPLLLALLGWVKISTLFVVCCLIGYLFLRLKMFHNRMLGLSLVALFITSLWTFKIVFEPREAHGSVSWFYFYKNYEISIPVFLTVSYIWAYIFIAVYIVSERIYKQQFAELFRSNKLLPIECIIFVSIAGFLPTMFLRIQNYDALYFTEVHMWLAASLVLVYIPFYMSGWSFSRKKALILLLPLLGLFYVFYVNSKVYAVTVLLDSVNHHSCLLNSAGISTGGMRIRNVIKQTIDSGEELYRNNKALSCLNQLKELDKLSLKEKRKTLVYVDFRSLIQRSDYNWGLYCHNIAFVVPALSGMAMIDGIDVTYFELCNGCCESIGLSYHYYPKWKTRDQINEPFNLIKLGERVREKGFENLIFFNLETESFEKVTLN